MDVRKRHRFKHLTSAGKDVTVKVIKKRQKHKSKGSVRTIEKKIKADSFFNFFDPPVVPALEGI